MLSVGAGADPRAEIATQRLSELVFETCSVLKSMNRGQAKSAYLKRGPLSRVFHSDHRRGFYTIVYGKPVWMLCPACDTVGINEDGGLGVTEDGELVATTNWLSVRGGSPVDPNSAQGRRLKKRMASGARVLGFDATVTIAASIEAFGGPQEELRFRSRNRKFKNAFYLDDSGDLVFGSPEESMDAAMWFSLVVELKTGSSSREVTSAERGFFDSLRSKQPVAAMKTAPARASVREVGIDDHKAISPSPGSQTGRLSFDAAMVATVAQAMRGVHAAAGTDISASGSVSARQFSNVDPTEGGIAADRLLDVLPVTLRPSAISGYSHWVQTRRESRETLEFVAAEPQGDFDDRVIRVDKRLEVLSHSSSVVDKAWLQDAADLERWLADEMIYRLRSAVEAKIVDDISKVSSIQVVEFETSPLVSIRRGLTHLPVADWHTAAVVVHPTDWESIELALVSTKDSVMPFEPAPRLLFGSPVIVSNAAVAGHALVLGHGAVGLSIDGSGVRVDWGSAPGSAVHEVVVGIQGSYQTDVYRPSAVVLVALAQAAGIANPGKTPI